jgi:hypothetical protein
MASKYFWTESAGRVHKNLPPAAARSVPGTHTIQGVKMGRADGPRDEMVYPVRRKTVSIKILILRSGIKPRWSPLKGARWLHERLRRKLSKAAESCEKAQKWIGSYSSRRPFYLGRAYNALFEEQKAEQLPQSHRIDPDTGGAIELAECPRYRRHDDRSAS